MPIGPLEILIVALVIVVIWRGPKMLPQFGEALGKAVKGARDTMDRDSSESKANDDDTPPAGQPPAGQ
jgi:TatA/E family protein of Tat protein translocase